MNRIFITGDTHANAINEMSRFNSKNFKKGNYLDKNDYVIITGDFGFLFSNQSSKEEKYWLNWLREKPWTTLFIDGNHENFPRLAWLETKEKFGNKVGVVNDSVFHLKRGLIYTIANKTFFCLGGAYSIDKESRIMGVSWWPEEEPNFHQTKRAYDSLDKVRWQVDYVITHDAPSWVSDKLKSHHNETSYTVRLLDDIFGKQKFTFKHHYFGHHHIDKTVMENHTCCYNAIHELKDK